MAEPLVAGWDLGGAHLKVALAAGGTRIIDVVQVPCPLWRGVERLTEAAAGIGPRLCGARRHGVTMTGELVDHFYSRGEGVERLIGEMTRTLPRGDLRVYAGRDGFLRPEEAVRRPREVASANWLASASLAAARLPQGLFLDVGSTTTDIVPFRDGRVLARGTTDDERLVCDELVYTGVVRTPVMAVVETVPFAGERQSLMAELFAAMADVYRLTGDLPDDADQLPAADGRDKSIGSSMRRLARMLGRDADMDEVMAWRRLAAHLTERQRRIVQDAVDRVLSRGRLDEDAPVVGAGVGRFLIRRLAAHMSGDYIDFGDLIEGEPQAKESAARCAPAAAVAILAAGAW